MAYVLATGLITYRTNKSVSRFLYMTTCKEAFEPVRV
jgi:hypothetical protein